MLNATFSSRHFLEAKTIAQGVVALACSFNEPPEIILMDIDVVDMSDHTMQWIKAASHIIVLINHKDEDINATQTGASAIMLKHQVIPFLTKLFGNVEEEIKRPGMAYVSEETSTDRSNKTNAFDGFMRRVFSRTVHSCVTATKSEK